MNRVLLRPGINIESWPEIKFARAVELWTEFKLKIAAWEATVPIRSKAVQVTPTEAWIVLEVVTQPPYESFAVSVGDALHNLRASLDAAVWSMATFDGRILTDDEARSVQMPVTQTPAKFESHMKRMPAMPHPEFTARIESLQPYHRAAANEAAGLADTLVGLHALDIVDKHRSAVVTAVAMGHIDMGGIGFKGDMAAATFEAAKEAPLRDGARVLSVKSTSPFTIEDYDSGVAVAQFSIAHGDGYARLLEFEQVMFGWVRNALFTLYGEDEVDDDSDAPDQTVSFVDGVVTVEHHENTPDTAD